jgi:hypothetical protein
VSFGVAAGEYTEERTRIASADIAAMAPVLGALKRGGASPIRREESSAT